MQLDEAPSRGPDDASMRAELAELRERVARDAQERRRVADQVAHLFRISTQLLVAQELDEQLRLVARGIVSACNFRRCVITLFDEDWHVWMRAHAGLTREEAEALEAAPELSPAVRRSVLDERYRVGQSYFIPHESDMGVQLSSLGVSTSRSREDFVDWHPEDFLFVPLRGKDEKILGTISVDDPSDGLRPTPESLTIVELFAREAAFAIEQSLLLRELSRTEAYLENLVTSSPDGIVTTDTTGNVVIFNEGAERMMGYTRGEMAGTSVVRLYQSEEEARDIMRRLMSAEVGEAGRLVGHETVLVAKDGEEIPVALSVSALYTDGVFVGTVGISRDLRAWKLMEKELRAAEKAATVAEVAATLCHEINNFLEEILSAGQVSLLTLDLDEVRRMYRAAGRENDLEKEIERLKVISREALKIASLTSRLQTMADRGGDYATTEYVGEIRMAELPDDRAARRGGRILVADDREYIREFLKDFLILEGFHVETASDGEEALSKVRAAHYDLVLSDIKMPRRNGYEVFAGVRERDPRTKVILMTAYGYDPSHSIVRASGEGLSAVLYKPFQMARVRDAIVKALSANGGGGGGDAGRSG
jgi:PAS domain S-box-containing protein